jgi:hypothetical protein
VGGHPLTFMESLHRGGSQPHIKPFSQQLKGNAVVMMIKFDMIVDILSFLSRIQDKRDYPEVLVIPKNC